MLAKKNAPRLGGKRGSQRRRAQISGTDQNLTELAFVIEQGCPQDGEWGMIYPPSVGTSLIPSLASFFNPTSEISRQYKRGRTVQAFTNVLKARFRGSASKKSPPRENSAREAPDPQSPTRANRARWPHD